MSFQIILNFECPEEQNKQQREKILEKLIVIFPELLEDIKRIAAGKPCRCFEPNEETQK